jgi:hypothetical protein
MDQFWQCDNYIFIRRSLDDNFCRSKHVEKQKQNNILNMLNIISFLSYRSLTVSMFHIYSLDFTQTVGLLGLVIGSSQGLYLIQGNTNTEWRAQTHTPNIHALSGIRTQDHGLRASDDSSYSRPLGYSDRLRNIQGVPGGMCHTSGGCSLC